MKLSHLIIAALTLAIAHPAATLYFQPEGETPQEKCIEATLATLSGSHTAGQIATAHQLCS